MSISVLLNGFDVIGQWMSGKLLFVSLEVAAFALIVWLIVQFLRFRSARVREAFWLTVLLKPLVAVLIAWPISLTFMSSGSSIQEQTLGSSAPMVAPETEGVVERSEPVVPPVFTSDVSTASSIESEPAHTVFTADTISWWRQLNWKRVIAILWLLGCGLMLGRLALGLHTLSKLRQKAKKTPEALRQMFSACSEQLNIHSRVELRLSKNIEVPMLFGLFRPVIVLPEWYADQFSQAELRLMLMHELAHWKYRDTWALLAKQLIEAIFFFHPAIWYAGRQIVKEAEAACDDLVVASSQQSRTYANCLMRVVEHAANTKHRVFVGLAAGGTVAGNRIRKLLQHSTIIPTKITLRAIIALLLVAVLGWPSVSGCISRGEVSAETILLSDRQDSVASQDVSAAQNVVPIVKIKDGVYRIGNLTLDANAREIIVPGKVMMTRGVIEYLATGKFGKTHETVLLLDVEPIHLQTALLRLGMKAGRNLRHQGDPNQPEGDMAEIWVEWELDEKRERHRAEDLIYDAKKSTPMQHTNWVFTGAREIGNVFTAQAYKNIIATYRDPDAIFNNPLPGGIDDTTYRVNSEVVPPEGTAVSGLKIDN